MKKALYLITLLLFCFSCEQEKLLISEPADSTIIMFYPWSTNLKSYFDQNIKDFASTVASEGLYNQRVIVCIESKPNYVDFIELKGENGTCTLDTLFSSSNNQFTTEQGLTKLFTKLRALSNTDTYSMIVGCHGMGWLPISSESDDEAVSKAALSADDKPLTRYFGGLTNEYKIEINTFAQGLRNADIYLEYILFDDCYMSSIEAAYYLKDVTHYLIACPTEIMAYGFPYHKCGKYLLGNPDYEKVCKEFYNFYANYESPYGTIAVTDCTNLDYLAELSQQINKYNSYNNIDISDIQQMDGYTPPIFYDFEDVMKHKCNNSYLFKKFQEQLQKAVPYKEHTYRYFSASKGAMKVSSFCGITTSDLSENETAQSVAETTWYIATH